MVNPAERKAEVSRIYDDIAERYDQVGPHFYGEVGADLVKRLGLKAGERILDAGCGRGACLFPAAKAVGPQGEAVGIDLSVEMVRHTAAQAQNQGLAQATVLVGDAESPDFPPDSFDAVLSGFVLRLIPDPDKALRAYRDLLRPGGRCGATIFVSSFDTRWEAVGQTLESFTRDIPAQPDALDSTMGFAALLAQCGFTGVEVADEAMGIELPDPDSWWQYLWYSGYRGRMVRIPRHDRDAARLACLAAVEPLRETDGRLVMDVRVRLATANRPV